MPESSIPSLTKSKSEVKGLCLPNRKREVKVSGKKMLSL